MLNHTQHKGLVISYFGNSVAVLDGDGQVFQCHLRRNQPLPVVGDIVVYSKENAETGIVLSIEPRRSLLARGDARGRQKPLAANVDWIVIVMAPPPGFSAYLVDRYLIAAELLNIEPIIVMNKIDLLTDETRAFALSQMQVYEEIGYQTILSSVKTNQGLETLNEKLKDKTAVLVGPSGVGKSSLISALSGIDKIKIGEVSQQGAGKHTTTATRLYQLPQGGALIDSPGVREFGLWPVTEQQLFDSFREFKRYMTGCKYRNCSHRVEPGCAVQKALSDGKISASRFEHYQLLLKEAAGRSARS